MKDETQDKYEIGKLKTFNGMEGQGYELILKRNGKVIANVNNYGDGGESIFGWKNESERIKLIKICKMMPQIDVSSYYNDGAMHYMDMNMESYVENLIVDYEREKLEKRLAKSGVWFRLVGDKPGVYTGMNCKKEDIPRLMENIKKKHGTNIEYIVNERVDNHKVEQLER